YISNEMPSTAFTIPRLPILKWRFKLLTSNSFSAVISVHLPQHSVAHLSAKTRPSDVSLLEEAPLSVHPHAAAMSQHNAYPILGTKAAPSLHRFSTHTDFAGQTHRPSAD